MGVLESAIMATCVSFSGMQNDACVKALQAGTKQTGIEQVANSTENKVTKEADHTAKEYLGDTPVAVAGGAVFVTKSIMDKTATVGLPNLGICSSMKAQIGKDKSTLSLLWNF